MLSRLFGRWALGLRGAEESRARKEQADGLVEQGHSLEDRGDAEAALSLYREAAEIAPDYARPYMNAAHALDELKRWDEAEAAHRKALHCAPDYAPARFNLGAFLMKLGKLDEAEVQLLAASRLQPTMVEAPTRLQTFMSQRTGSTMPKCNSRRPLR